MNVEFLNAKIAALEVRIQELDKANDSLNEWIIAKKQQCIKCKVSQKATKDKLMRDLTALKAGMDARFLQPFEDDGCECGGNCQVEGADCC
jgi:hypothetical protein